MIRTCEEFTEEQRRERVKDAHDCENAWKPKKGKREESLHNKLQDVCDPKVGCVANAAHGDIHFLAYEQV